MDVTGFDACSLQPTSGASGEYAGLLVIKKYLESKGQGHGQLHCLDGAKQFVLGDDISRLTTILGRLSTTN